MTTAATDISQAQAEVRLHGVAVAADGTAWWDEALADEPRRATVVRRTPDGRVGDLLPPTWSLPLANGSAMAGSWLPVSRDDVAVVRADDRRIYLLPAHGTPRPLTPDSGGTVGCADLVPDPGGAAVWCVRERAGPGVVQRSLSTVALDAGSAVRDVYTTSRALASPRPSPDGRRLAWLEWDPSAKPWDGCELKVGELTADGVTAVRTLLGGRSEAAFQPEWCSPDSLYVVSDRTFWWNLYQVWLNGTIRPLCTWPEEFGWPQVEPGLATYGPLADGRLAVLHGTDQWRLDLLDPGNGDLVPLELPFTAWQPTLRTAGSTVIGVAGGPSDPAAVVLVDALHRRVEVLRSTKPGQLVAGLPRAHLATFFGPDGREVHAVVHPPVPTTGDAASRAPYLVVVHDGPAAPHLLDAATADLLRAGIGLAEVDCRGSSGHGRGYREFPADDLDARADDCAVVARGLVHDWPADSDLLLVKGIGTGAAVALSALTTGAFAAAAIQADPDDLAPAEPAASVPAGPPGWAAIARTRLPVLLLPRQPGARGRAAELGFYQALLAHSDIRTLA